jgi:hypothetical protein
MRMNTLDAGPRGEKPGFPRIRAVACYHSAEFRVGDGLTLCKSARIGIVGIPGEIKCKWHRALSSSNTATAILTRQSGKNGTSFSTWKCSRPDNAKVKQSALNAACPLLSLCRTARRLSVRIGPSKQPLDCGVDSGDWLELSAGQTQCQDTCAFGGLRCEVARRRADFLQGPSAELSRCYAGIGVEDLNIVGLARSPQFLTELDAVSERVPVIEDRLLVQCEPLADRLVGELASMRGCTATNCCPRPRKVEHLLSPSWLDEASQGW